MKVDRALVSDLAHLARLDVPEAAMDGLISDLQGVLDHVATLSHFHAAHVTAQTDIVETARAALRADVPYPFTHRTEALAAAPEVSGDAFVVPKVLDP